MPDAQSIVDALRKVFFPGIERDIVSLGYLKDIRSEGDQFVVCLELSTNQAGAGERIEEDAHAALRAAGIPYRLEMQVRYLASEPEAAEPERLLAAIPVKIAVASGKGGVGKSTVAANLAIGLGQLGIRTGLLDADIYGPSVPLMFGLDGVQPRVSDHQMEPLERYGIRTMSLGFLVDRHTPMVWRGPMAGKAIEQLMSDVNWAGTEALVFDLPPGTGDVQISISQKISLTGAVIVTTPQEVALIDAGKGVSMFRKVSVPILGLVENMSYFVCPHCQGQTDIFGSGGGAREAARLEVPLLGQIPLDPRVVVGGDEGAPVLVRDPASPAGQAFRELAVRVAKLVGLP